MEEKKNKQNKDKKNYFWVIIVVLIVIIILLLLRSCGTGQVVNPPINNDPVIEDPVGNFNVSDKQQEKEEVEKVPNEIPSITFAGYGRYKVSKENPNIELKNPAVNFVDMVFTVKDGDDGEIIARTGKIKAGEFVYVNVLDFYKQSGTYDVVILTSTYDSETGVAMNGMKQEMEVIIK